MSKHLDLMQQLERDQAGRSHRPLDPLSPSVAKPHREAGWTNEEALRLVQRVFLLQTRKRPQVVAFVGIDHACGCTSISVAVAEALATNGSDAVCIVETNFRSPSLASVLGITDQKGLTGALLGDASILSFATRVGNENLWAIPAGMVAEDSANLLTSERFKARLLELRNEFDFVILDTPPLNQFGDAIAIGHLTDGVVLVLEADSTRKETAQTAVATLSSSNIEILAAVLNKRKYPIPEQIYKRL